MSNFNRRQRSVLVVDRYSFNSIEGGIGSIDDLAENRVFAIEMGLLRVRDEELRLVRIWATVGHSNDTPCIELER